MRHRGILAVVAALVTWGLAQPTYAVFGDRGLVCRGPRARTAPPPEEEEPEPPPPRPRPEVGLTLARARPMITRYYDSRGQWAGQYVIDEVAQVRFVQHGETMIHAHVRYRYRCVLEYCGGTQRVGYDQRVFYFERAEGGDWRITWMGGHMSAQM